MEFFCAAQQQIQKKIDYWLSRKTTIDRTADIFGLKGRIETWEVKKKTTAIKSNTTDWWELFEDSSALNGIYSILTRIQRVLLLYNFVPSIFRPLKEKMFSKQACFSSFKSLYGNKKNHYSFIFSLWPLKERMYTALNNSNFHCQLIL